MYNLKTCCSIQALVLATRYSSIKDANLSGRKLTAIRDLLMKQFQQVGCLLFYYYYLMGLTIHFQWMYVDMVYVIPKVVIGSHKANSAYLLDRIL